MSLGIDLRVLPASEALLACDASTPPQAQISQEVLQGAAYLLRTPE
jgi:hypothetical protein